VYRKNVSEQAWHYLNGLVSLEKGKANMERMEERDDSMPYHQYQHFLSNSPWSHKSLIKQVGQDADAVMRKEREKTGKPTGFIVDESGHLKKGEHSVGVSRQYCGTVGKVDNCQVGVYSSLCTGHRSTLIDERLYLPCVWTDDVERCKRAGIPEQDRVFKTKLELALEMVDAAVENQINFDWVGGDGLYGHNYEFSREIEARDLLFTLDVHKDQQVYLLEPELFIADKQSGRGRPPSRYQTLAKPVRVDVYAKQLSVDEWEKIRIRKTTKGWLKAWIHCVEIWVWDGIESKARRRTLIIRKTIGNNGQALELKYSLSNGTLEKYDKEQFAYMQAQRYWVERNFDDAKNELGMSDYQVRKWAGWHHHHAIVLMALLFMLKEQIDHEADYPLMSVADARKMVLVLIAQTIIPPQTSLKNEINKMNIRHLKRKKSINYYYNNRDS